MNLRAGAAQAPAPGEFIDQPARHAAAGLPAPMPPQPAGYRLGAAVRHGIRRAPNAQNRRGATHHFCYREHSEAIW